jgi:hypothetical protein
MKSNIFWDTMLCSPLKVNWCFICSLKDGKKPPLRQQIWVLCGAVEVHAHCAYQGTKYALSGHSPASTLMSCLLLSQPPLHLWLTHLTSSPYTSIPCPTHTYNFSIFFLCPFSEPYNLLFLPPTDSLSGHVRTQQFHLVPWWANGNWGPLLHFPPASYIIWNFQPANYSACHLLSHW